MFYLVDLLKFRYLESELTFYIRGSVYLLKESEEKMRRVGESGKFAFWGPF